MGFMQKNVNVYLLILVLIVAGALAGSSVYYQQNLDGLTSKQDTIYANLSQCSADLESYKFNLNKTMRSLNTTTQDIRRYDELYTTKTEELETTQSTLEETSKDLKSTKLDLQEETALKNKYKNDYEDQLQISRDLEEQNAILAAQKKQLEAQVIMYKQNEDDVDSCISNFLSDYDAGLTQAMKDDANDCRP
jgi:chromosome segregation ATPase